VDEKMELRFKSAYLESWVKNGPKDQNHPFDTSQTTGQNNLNFTISLLPTFLIYFIFIRMFDFSTENLILKKDIISQTIGSTGL
jgi:hypothetical protein